MFVLSAQNAEIGVLRFVAFNWASAWATASSSANPDVCRSRFSSSASRSAFTVASSNCLSAS